MSIEQFKLLPIRLGWKHEYYNGKAHLRPGHSATVAVLKFRRRVVQRGHDLRAVTPADAPALTKLFVQAFGDTVEYCDCTQRRVRESADKSIEGYFAGARGKALAASRVAVQGKRFLGAALVVQTALGPMLDILFVHPKMQRRGIATALMSAVCNELAAAGEKKLATRYHLGNEPSVAWHGKFGFVELPDLMLAQGRHRVMSYELWRRRALGNLTRREEARLKRERDRWSAQVRRLDKLVERKGFEAACPFLQFRRARET